MSNILGALALPIPVPEPDDSAGDPLLELLGEFLTAVINEECSAAWQGMAKDGTEAVNAVFTFDPKRRPIESKKFPALFIWRTEDGADRQVGDLHISTNNICILWVQPSTANGPKMSRRDPFWHGVMSAARLALTTDRHPAWTHEDDDTDGGAFYGSCFSKWANLYSEPKVGKAKPEQIIVDFEGSTTVAPGYVGASMMLMVDEVATGVGAPALPFSGGVTGTIVTGDDQGHEHLAFTLGVTVLEVDPATGDAAGGETVTILGNGFVEDCTVLFGDTAATSVTWESSTELTVETPSHAAGLVDVTVTNPSGEVGVLEDAFTFA